MPSVDQFGTGVALIQGWFSDTIPVWLNEVDGMVQFLHIDCDLYSSARTVLFGLNDRLPVGAVILFDELLEDEWYTNWKEGEWKALLEWLQECGREVRPIGRAVSQAAFVIIK